VFLVIGFLALTLEIRFGSGLDSGAFSDEFDSPSLDDRWTIVDPDGGSTFDLTINPGWLRMRTYSPPWRDLIGSFFLTAPRLVQSVSGDFIVETKIFSVMDENDEGAGILVWKDSHNYLRLERMSRTIGNPVEQQIFFCGTIGGEFPIPGETKIVLPSGFNPTYLRLRRIGNVFSGFYSSDGIEWNHVADVTFQAEDPIQIGLDALIVYHDGPFSANFDYFRVESLSVIVPDDFGIIQEAINNANEGDTIFVRSGYYFENVVVNKTVSLLGEDKNSAVLNGTAIESPIVNVEANDVKISGFRFEGWSFQDILVNATAGVKIVGNKIVFNAMGVYVEGSVNVIMEDNIIDGHGLDNIGIMLAYSSGCSIIENAITNAIYDGIRLWHSQDNIIRKNNITDNDYGIFFHESSHNNLTDNLISENGNVGVYFESGSSDNRIFHNNFVENYDHARSFGTLVNIWDDGYASAGNYWSDYVGFDLYYGIYQNETGSDGIGDTPYVIDENNADRYPLMRRWLPLMGDVNNDGVVGLSDLVLLAKAYSSKPEDLNWDPYADFDRNFKVGLTDLVALALHYGQHYS
jgi:parallel beta-helix repeat protein